MQLAAENVKELLAILLSQELHAIFRQLTFHTISPLNGNAHLAVCCQEAFLLANGHSHRNPGTLLDDNRAMRKRVWRYWGDHQSLHRWSKDWPTCSERVRRRPSRGGNDQRVRLVVGNTITVAFITTSFNASHSCTILSPRKSRQCSIERSSTTQHCFVMLSR